MPHDNPYDPASPNYHPPADTVAPVHASAGSIHFGDWVVDDRFWLSVTAQFTPAVHPDSVWTMLDSTRVSRLQQSDSDSRVWLTESEEPEIYANTGGRIEMLVGYPLTLRWWVSGGDSATSAPFYLKRVIYDLPAVQFPDYDTTLTTRQPHLRWDPYYDDFKYTFTVEVTKVTATNFRQTVFRATGISPDSLGCQVTTNLPLVQDPEFLYWTIGVVDDFGNTARSLEARFNVEP